jgi:hypothetical protein
MQLKTNKNMKNIIVLLLATLFNFSGAKHKLLFN